jgi:hypothetical protein
MEELDVIMEDFWQVWRNLTYEWNLFVQYGGIWRTNETYLSSMEESDVWMKLICPVWWNLSYEWNLFVQYGGIWRMNGLTVRAAKSSHFVAIFNIWSEYSSTKDRGVVIFLFSWIFYGPFCISANSKNWLCSPREAWGDAYQHQLSTSLLGSYLINNM